MARTGSASLKEQFSLAVLISYVFDWVVLIVIVGISYVLGNIEPNKRHFSLVDPNISFPFAEVETVPGWLLAVLCGGLPVVAIAFVTLIFVPGTTVPKNTPAALVWKRKLWELHVGWLGLLMAVGSAWFFVSGMKNMCGKPRPDMLSRCNPDIDNADKYVVGGFTAFSGSHVGTLYHAGICRQTDSYKLNDGFRSYPSGHSAASAGGLIYLSLFLASKFSVTIPFVIPDSSQHASSVHAAFPSRIGNRQEDYNSAASAPLQAKVNQRNFLHNSEIQSLRRQAAAPPVYLLAITLVPFCVAIFIACSRWFNFRHHGFDILFGFLIGTITSIFSFRYYHLPIRVGAGWAWAPRSRDRAFWAGVGRLGYAGQDESFAERMIPRDLGESGSVDLRRNEAPATAAMLNQRHGINGAQSYQDVELQPMEGGRI